MAIPDYQSLMLPILKLAAQGEFSVPMAAVEIAKSHSLSAAEAEEMLPSGKQRLLHNRIHWAKFYLTKTGLLESPKRRTLRAIAARSNRQRRRRKKSSAMPKRHSTLRYAMIY